MESGGWMLKDRPTDTHRPMMTKKTPEQPSVHRNSNAPHHGSLPQQIQHQSRVRTSDRAPASLRNLSDSKSETSQMRKQYMKTRIPQSAAQRYCSRYHKRQTRRMNTFSEMILKNVLQLSKVLLSLQPQAKGKQYGGKDGETRWPKGWRRKTQRRQQAVLVQVLWRAGRKDRLDGEPDRVHQCQSQPCAG